MIVDATHPSLGLMSTRREFQDFMALFDAYRVRSGLNDRQLSLAAGLDASYVSKMRRRTSIPKMDPLRGR